MNPDPTPPPRPGSFEIKLEPIRLDAIPQGEIHNEPIPVDSLHFEPIPELQISHEPIPHQPIPDIHLPP